MSGVFRRHFMREKEVKQLLINFSQRFGVDTERFFGSSPNIELVDAKFAEIFIVNGKPMLARVGGLLFPTLMFDDLSLFLPRVVVDMGAVSHVCNGAEVMAPGVVAIQGEFNKEELLFIVDERHKRSVAIGIALFDSKTMKTLKHGRIVKNLHYVGDKLWNTIKELA